MSQLSEEHVRQGSLWRHRGFLLLWSGETISQTGAQISLVAVPLTAISVLDAGPAEVAWLTALQYAPVFLITLFAGAWLDRHRRRPVLVATNALRFLLLLFIPVCYLADVLTLSLLYLVTFGVGLLTAVTDVAYLVYLSTVVPPGRLIEANARLEGAYATAEIGGPGLGGVLVQVLTAPVALVANALTSLLAAAAFLGIRQPEAVPEPEGERRPMRTEIAEGLREIFRHPILRHLVLQGAVFNLFERIVLTMYLLYGIRELGLSAGQLGIALATASVGSLLGAAAAARAAAAFGVGRSILGSIVISAAGLVVIPFAPASSRSALIVLIIGFVVYGFGLGIFHVHSLSLRIALAPPGLLGRIQASFRLILYGAIPIGALLAGVLGDWVGIRTTLIAGSLTLLAVSLLFWFSSVRRTDMPVAAADGSHA